MIRSHFTSFGRNQALCVAAAMVMSMTLAGCATDQKQAEATIQDVVPIVPPGSSTAVASINDPYVVATAQNTANGQPLSGDTQSPQMVNTATVAPTEDNQQGSALGIMQSTRVKANTGSIFSSLTTDQATYDPNDPNAAARSGTSVKPVQASLFSNSSRAAGPSPAAPVPAPQASAESTTGPAMDSDYDAGIVVLHRQTDEERRIMAEKNDLTKNAHPQIRAMEPDAQARPANQRTVHKKR